MSHKYYFLNRPPSIGTHPAGETAREVWQPVRKIFDTERHAHGWVEYPEPLDWYDVWRYELFPSTAIGLSEYLDWREENNR